MAAEENKGIKNSGTGSSSGAGSTPPGGQAAGKAKTGGQEISGEQIFVTTEKNTGGSESFATTGAGASSATGSGAGGAGNSGGDAEKSANLSDAVTDAVSGDTGKAKEMLNQAKSATGQVASQALGQVQEKASTFVDTKTSDVAQNLTAVADSVRQFTDNLRSKQDAPIAQTVAQYGDTITKQVENLAGYLDRADLNKLARDAESFARKNPAVFIGSAFALGILAARFIKSSQQRAAIAPDHQLTAGSMANRGSIGAAGTTSGAKTSGIGTTGTTGTSNIDSTKTGGTGGLGTTGGATTKTSNEGTAL